MKSNAAKPTASELAQIAARLGPTLSPEEAITRATALWKAADRASRGNEIAEEEESEQLRAECERLERVGLGWQCNRISLSDAFQVAIAISHRLGKKAYHNENSFAVAMRKAKLTRASPIYGKSIQEWVKSAEPEMPIVGADEYTSTKAVEELYRQKAETKRIKDRKRKAAKKVEKRANENSQKSSAERKSGKAERRNSPIGDSTGAKRNSKRPKRKA